MDVQRAYRYAVIGLAALMVTQRIALAAVPGDIVGDIGRQVLGVVFSLGGLAGAIGAAVVGVRLIIGSASGSSYATSQAIMALLGVIGGIGLMLAGPAIADAVIKAMAGVPRNITLPTP
jgi:hypothetical protein